MATESSHGRARRAGVTLIETVVAAAMLAVVLASSARVMVVLSAQQRAAERHAFALQSASNLLEQWCGRPWDALASESAVDLGGVQSFVARLPGAAATVTVAEEGEPVRAKRVTVALSWTAPNGQPAGPVRLTGWVFPPEVIER